uniref:Helitron helicase-like domain-containing protein n=1 Tax=Tanacetum cinerariifolium TaxID=118510 RepID=A0A699IB34_TANCI|nr:helitron helicase-like domain-containing protein [Tanacetum cinerariifolium]
MLGAIVYERGPETEINCDIFLEELLGYPRRINKLHPSYMSLQFSLLFLYGEDGYSKELKLIGGIESSNADKRLSMKAYYAYYMYDRANCYNYLSRTTRPFQHIYDAIIRGDNDGFDCGGRLILPQSFMGEPRRILAYYLVQDNSTLLLVDDALIDLVGTDAKDTCRD